MVNLYFQIFVGLRFFFYWIRTQALYLYLPVLQQLLFTLLMLFLPNNMILARLLIISFNFDYPFSYSPFCCLLCSILFIILIIFFQIFICVHWSRWSPWSFLHSLQEMYYTNKILSVCGGSYVFCESFGWVRSPLRHV